MARLNILVSGVGAIIGYGIVNSLKLTGRKLNIVGMDIYSDAVGQHFCDRFVQAKRAGSSEYLDFLVDVIKRYHIDLVFFGTEQELYQMSDSRDLLPDYFHKLVLNTRSVVDVSRDKLKTHLFLSQYGVEAIPTRVGGSFAALSLELGLPFILKLRHSYASKGVFKIHDEQDFNYWKVKAGGNFLAQELVGDDGHEYTAAIFGRGEEEALEPFVLRRRLSGEGATARAVVEEIPELCETIGRLADLLRAVGPTNFQFRRHHGKYLLLEINPRISSSTSIRAAFGYNEAEMCIRYYLEKGQISMPFLRSGSAVRFIADWIIYEDGIDL
ncbi:ATP-grasp domain-containing protein [uncultured Thiodictyon sp.]|uniref:ATP-grasp domain-containing protein n=1 Tax=uncultured Thiodictyon sp. TaxID=1846217 RepID=UPI0025EDC9D9|nr:ATP-grasp domain-containing protein [uncultured Thiodictyon sp.]